MTPLRDAQGRFVRKGQAGAGGMVGLDVTVENNSHKLDEAAERAAFRNFKQAAYAVMVDARASIESDPLSAAGVDQPSPPGTPPHTRRANWLRRAIRFWGDKYGAFIGPVYSLVGKSGAAHELGEDFKGDDFPERAFMGPARDRQASRFAGSWQGSIGE